MTDAITIDQTIEQVAQGLAKAGVAGASSDDLKIKSVELTLKLTTSKAVGAKAEGKFLGILTIGGEAKWERANTTELVVTLEVPEDKEKRESQGLGVEVDLTDDVAAGIESIRKAAASAAQHLALVPFAESTLTLSFEVKADGSISVLGTGEIHSDRAHTAKITLVPNAVA